MDNKDKIQTACLTEEDEIKADSEEKDIAAEYKNDISTVLSTPSGIRLFKRIFESGGLMSRKSINTGNSRTFYELGKFEFAQSIFLDMQEVEPQKVLQLLIFDSYKEVPE